MEHKKGSCDALETEDWLVLSGLGDDGEGLDEAQCRCLFDLPAKQGDRCEIPAAAALDDPTRAAGSRW